MHIIISHGRGSTPNSKKLVYMARAAEKLGHTTHRVDDSDTQDPERRAQRLMTLVANETRPMILVGSSMGGYTSLLAAKDNPLIKGLFLLCPGLYLPRYEVKDYPSKVEDIAIVHGWRDDVVLYEHSVRFAREHRATLHLIDTDHSMQNNIPDILLYFNLFLARFNADKLTLTSSPP